VTIIRHRRVAEEATAISRAAHNRLESRRSSEAANERDRARGKRVTGVSTRAPCEATMEVGQSGSSI